MKTKNEKIRNRYEAALLSILGQSWRKWWLDQPSNERINRQTVESTHRKKLERMEAESEQSPHRVDYNRQAEKSFKYSYKYLSYCISLVLIGLILFASVIVQNVMKLFGIEVSDFLGCIFIGASILLLSAGLYLLWLVISLASPTETTQYVAAEWKDYRKVLLKSGLIQAVAEGLVLQNGPDFLEELEYCAERSVVDTDVSNAIHHAYREHIIALCVEKILTKFKELVAAAKDSEDKTAVLRVLEADLGELINIAPIFFVPHGPKEFRLIIYSNAFNQVAQNQK